MPKHPPSYPWSYTYGPLTKHPCFQLEFKCVSKEALLIRHLQLAPSTAQWFLLVNIVLQVWWCQNWDNFIHVGTGGTDVMPESQRGDWRKRCPLPLIICTDNQLEIVSLLFVIVFLCIYSCVWLEKNWEAGLTNGYINSLELLVGMINK